MSTSAEMSISHSLTLDLSSPELSAIIKPAMQLSRSLTPAPKKLPPPPPRKPPQRSHSYWIKDNLQMSITSDIEHSDLDIEDYKKGPIASIHPPTISLDIPYRNNNASAHRRRHSDMPPTQKKKKSRTKNIIKKLSVDIKRKSNDEPKRSSTPRAYVRRNVTPRSSPIADGDDTPDNLPSLRSVNRHKAKVTQQRLRKNRMSTRKLIRRKQRADSGLTRCKSSSDSDDDNGHKSIVKKRKLRKKKQVISHQKSQSAPFAIRNIKLSDLYHMRHEKHKKRSKKKVISKTPKPKRNKLKNKEKKSSVKSHKNNKFKDKTHKNNKFKDKSTKNNKFKDTKSSVKSPKNNKFKKPKKINLMSPKNGKTRPKSPRSPLSRIKDNKAKRVSKSKFVPAIDDDDDVYRSYKVKEIPNNMDNKSFWSRPSSFSAI